ncbi:MAG: hypothetical protein WC489_00625 [Patescibacteria group bacterium]
MKTEVKALIRVINSLVKSGRLNTEESDCLVRTTKNLTHALHAHDTNRVRKQVAILTKTILKIIA